MMHRIIHRQRTGCYKLLANRFHHVCRGRPGTQLRNGSAVLIKQEAKQQHSLLENIQVLQRIDLRCFDNNFSRADENRENMGRHSTFPKNLKNLLKDSSDSMSLWLKPLNDQITKEEIYEMSEDIKNVEVIKRPDKTFCFVKFETEEIAEKNFEILNARKDVMVQYRGPKANRFEREKKARTLWFGKLSPDTTEEDVYDMSADIFKVSLRQQTNGEKYAFVEFPSETMAVENYKMIKEQNSTITVAFPMDREGDPVGHKLYFGNLTDSDTEEDIRKLSDDILGVAISGAVTKKRFAHADFSSREAAMKLYMKLKRQKDIKWNVQLAGRLNDDNCVLVIPNSDANWTKENFWDLSEDTIEVTIQEPSDKPRIVFLEFLTPEKTRENFRLLKKKGLIVLPRTGKGKKFADRSLYVDNLEPEMTEESLLNLCPEILGVEIRTNRFGNRFALLEYQSETAAVEAYKKLHQSKTIEVSLRGEKNLDFRSRSLLLGNLANDIVEQDLYRFSDDIINVLLQIKPNGKRTALVEYASPITALRNYEKLRQIEEMTVKRLTEDGVPPMIWMDLKQKWTRATLQELSPDIGAIDIRYRLDESEYAFLHFCTTDKLVKNFREWRTKGLTIDLPNDVKNDPQNQLKIGEIPENWTERDIENLSNDILSVFPPNPELDSRYAFVQFYCKEHAERNIKVMEEAGLQVQPRAKPDFKPVTDSFRYKLWIGKLEHGTTKQDVLKMSRNITNAVVKENKQGKCYAFAKCESAKTLQETYRKLKEEGFTVSLDDDRTLWLGRIGKDKTKEDIMKLSDDIVTCRVHLDKEPGFAFLEFDSKETADKNLENLTKLLENDDMYVMRKKASFVNDSEGNTLWLGRIGKDKTEEDIMKLSDDIVKCRTYLDKEPGYAFLEFDSKEKADENLKNLAKLLANDPMRVSRVAYYEQQQAKKTLWMGFPNAEVTEEDIRELSSDITSVTINTRNSQSYAFLEFPSVRLAKKNLESFEDMGLLVEFKRVKSLSLFEQ